VSFFCPGLRGERAHASHFKLFGLEVCELLRVRTVITHVIAVAHELQVVGAVVRRVEVTVMNDRSLPVERRDFPQQSAAGHDPMHALAHPHHGMLNELVAVLVRANVEGH
jgi:hypothetical protein